MCRKGETKELVVYAWPLQPVCFRSALKDHPFISPYILVSVVTQREASWALSCRDLQRIMRASVPGSKCLSGLTDNSSEISACDKMCGDPCTETHVADEIVATTSPCVAHQIPDKTENSTDVQKLSECVSNVKYFSCTHFYLKSYMCVFAYLSILPKCDNKV